jgi:hypothetical protein
MKPILIMAAVAATVAGGPVTAATNLIVNGSFETGDFAGFVHSNAPSAYQAVVLDYGSTNSYQTSGGGAFGEAVPVDNATGSLSPDAAGAHGAYFVADNSVNEAISQLTALHPGNYEIGFDAYLPQNGANNPFNATINGSIIGVNVANLTASEIGATHWFNISGVASVSLAGRYLTAFTYNSNGSPAKDFVIDKVYVVATEKTATFTIPPTPTAAIPEPATWGLMIAGFVMVGASMRRRTQNAVSA